MRRVVPPSAFFGGALGLKTKGFIIEDEGESARNERAEEVEEALI